MEVSTRKPILVAGLSISALLLLGEMVHREMAVLGDWSFWGAIALGGGFWWWRRQSQKSPVWQPPVPLTPEIVERAIADQVRR